MPIVWDGLAASDRELREQLQHVYWIGGGSGAGKSTIARRIAYERGLQLYATDDVMPNHARRSTPESSPLLHEFIAMDMDERWVNRSPQTMLESFHWFRGEAFGMIIDDLVRLPKQPDVIAEGFRLLPHLVQPLLATPRHAVWLLPTSEFRQAVFESRGGTQWGFIGKTSHPERALRNVLDRDAMFTNQLAEEAKRRSLNIVLIDNRITVDDLTSQVLEMFGL
jgi:2-phosphoglycerate kinase